MLCYGEPDTYDWCASPALQEGGRRAGGSCHKRRRLDFFLARAALLFSTPLAFFTAGSCPCRPCPRCSPPGGSPHSLRLLLSEASTCVPTPCEKYKDHTIRFKVLWHKGRHHASASYHCCHAEEKVLTVRCQKSQSSMRRRCQRGSLCITCPPWIKKDLRADWQVIVTSWTAAHGWRS